MPASYEDGLVHLLADFGLSLVYGTYSPPRAVVGRAARFTVSPGPQAVLSKGILVARQAAAIKTSKPIDATRPFLVTVVHLGFGALVHVCYPWDRVQGSIHEQFAAPYVVAPCLNKHFQNIGIFKKF